MNEQAADKKTFDIASISRKDSKRKNYVQDAFSIDPARIQASGKFIRVFSDLFLKREAGPKAKIYF